MVRHIPYCLDIGENAVHDAPDGISSKFPIIGSGLGPGGNRNDLRVNLLRSKVTKTATSTAEIVSDETMVTTSGLLSSCRTRYI